eukprot:SAG11_NODE_2204_length_3694_cov_11.683171_2_plen_208_part_00
MCLRSCMHLPTLILSQLDASVRIARGRRYHAPRPGAHIFSLGTAEHTGIPPPARLNGTPSTVTAHKTQTPVECQWWVSHTRAQQNVRRGSISSNGSNDTSCDCAALSSGEPETKAHSPQPKRPQRHASSERLTAAVEGGEAFENRDEVAVRELDVCRPHLLADRVHRELCRLHGAPGANRNWTISYWTIMHRVFSLCVFSSRRYRRP